MTEQDTDKAVPRLGEAMDKGQEDMNKEEGKSHQLTGSSSRTESKDVFKADSSLAEMRGDFTVQRQTDKILLLTRTECWEEKEKAG